MHNLSLDPAPAFDHTKHRRLAGHSPPADCFPLGLVHVRELAAEVGLINLDLASQFPLFIIHQNASDLVEHPPAGLDANA